MELQAVSGQLFIIDGIEQDQNNAPGVLVIPAPGNAVRGRQHEVLFAHLTLTGSLSETGNLIQGLLQGISQNYFQSDGSVTASLRRVVQETNKRLLQMNLSGKGPAREGAISCAVLHKNELFVVQAGESLAFLGHNFGVERLPARTLDFATPLGRTAGVDFRYYHQRLQTGDMLLLADPRIAHLPSHALAPALVDTEIDLGLAELKEAVGNDSGRLLLVEFTDQVTASNPIVAKPIIQAGRITLPKRSTTAAVSGTAVLIDQPLREPVRHQPGSSTTFTSADSLELGETVETTARQAASRSALGLSVFTGWLADFMVRVRPPVEREEGETHWVVPTVIAIIIPLIVTIIVSGVYLQRGRVRRVADLRQEMSQNLVLAQENAGDPDESRAHYMQLMSLAAEADELRPGDPGVAEMRRQALIALDNLDGVTRLTAVPIYSFGRGSEIEAIALGDDFTGGIYALDGSDGTVYLLDTDESYTTLVAEDAQKIGFTEQSIGNHVVLDLKDIMWRSGGVNISRDGLAMLDAGGALISYYQNLPETRAAPLGLSSEWLSPVAISQFSERLYILDPASASIWKYFPQEDEFIVDSAERKLELGPDADLAQAVDLDIYSEDGSLLLTYEDNRLRYYDTRSGRLQWDETDLLQNGLATPLVNPVAGKLVGRGLNASIFVLDAGNGRVIQISRGGTVLAQYRATDDRGNDIFVGGTDLTIAETPLRIFVTVGNKIYIATQ